MAPRFRLLALLTIVALLAVAPTASAGAITINEPTGGFTHGTNYIYDVAGIVVPAGQEITWAKLTLLNFHDWTTETNDIRFGFVRNDTGSAGHWRTVGPFPAATDWFWTLTNLSATPATYGPHAIPTTDLSFMASKFGIAVDPNCHFYGNIELTYGTAQVPEPASLLLLGTGLLGAVRAARRRRA